MIGRPRRPSKDPQVERRRQQYRRAKERARHLRGECTLDHGMRCSLREPDIGGPYWERIVTADGRRVWKQRAS